MMSAHVGRGFAPRRRSDRRLGHRVTLVGRLDGWARRSDPDPEPLVTDDRRSGLHPQPEGLSDWSVKAYHCRRLAQSRAGRAP